MSEAVDRIAEIVKVSPPGAALEVFDVRLTDKGRKALTILKPSKRHSPMEWLPVIMLVVPFVGLWGMILIGTLVWGAS